MQRRAAAIYVAFFLVVGAASYSLIATAQTPTVEFEDPEYRLSAGDEFQIDGQTYTVSAIEETEESGGHGGGTSIVRSGEVAWTNDSARLSAEWENDSTVEFQDDQWRVVVENAEEPSEVTLREEINETAILEADPQADNETVTRDGERYVVLTENDTSRLVLAEEYFPTPEEQTFSQGDTVDYEGNESTVDVATGTVTLTWTGPQQNTLALDDAANVTLGGETYLAYFPSGEEVVLTQQFDSYNSQLAEIDTFHERENGLWGISIVSGIVAILLVGMAFLPSRY